MLPRKWGCLALIKYHFLFIIYGMCCPRRWSISCWSVWALQRPATMWDIFNGWLIKHGFLQLSPFLITNIKATNTVSYLVSFLSSCKDYKLNKETKWYIFIACLLFTRQHTKLYRIWNSMWITCISKWVMILHTNRLYEKTIHKPS